MSNAKFNISGSFIELYFPIWKSSQTYLKDVLRWKPYLSDGIGKNMREQSVLEHEHSVTAGAMTVVRMIDPFVFEKTGKHLDLLFIHTAYMWHDHPEGLRGIDTPAPLKRDEDDVEEYLVFMEHIKYLPKQIKEEYERAFLLQFATNGNKLFPKEASYIIENILLKNYYYEALFFSAFERYEYLFYPKEMEANHEYLLTWVIRRQIIHYQKFARLLPGFREVLFSTTLELECLNYLKANEDVPEPKF